MGGGRRGVNDRQFQFTIITTEVGLTLPLEDKATVLLPLSQVPEGDKPGLYLET